MLHYRIYGFLRTELLVSSSFRNEVFHMRAAMKTQPFANMWKVALVPFASYNYVPVREPV